MQGPQQARHWLRCLAPKKHDCIWESYLDVESTRVWARLVLFDGALQHATLRQ